MTDWLAGGMDGSRGGGNGLKGHKKGKVSRQNGPKMSFTVMITEICQHRLLAKVAH